jgi:putative molybdopterin biosynthesis protein
MENEAVLTAAEVARSLRIAKNTVYKLVERGELRAYRVGTKFRFDRADVDAYRAGLSTQSVGAPQRVEAVPFTAASVSPPGEGPFVLCGQDLLLDILARRLESRLDGLRVYRSNLGSYNGLYALYRGSAHAATVHLWDGDTNTYNLPYLRFLLPGMAVTVVRLARRTVGFYVPVGNPKGLRSWEDLRRTDLSIANRERGSGIRVLLDERLRLAGRDGRSIPGYGREVPTHLAAASAVARGEADFALGSEKAARQAAGIDFIPLQEECYDLVLRAEDAEKPIFSALLSEAASEGFREELSGLGGYGLSETGSIVFP